MKVYVLEQGEWDARRIMSVFSSIEVARKALVDQGLVCIAPLEGGLEQWLPPEEHVRNWDTDVRSLTVYELDRYEPLSSEWQ